RTFLDSFYFVRGKDDYNIIPITSHFYTVAEFSTSHDNSVAKIIAYHLLLTKYSKEINVLTTKPNCSNNPTKWRVNRTDC
ncbi:MAG: RteC domain-containing protein, partial [Bacteroidota bacterium]